MAGGATLPEGPGLPEGTALPEGAAPTATAQAGLVPPRGAFITGLPRSGTSLLVSLLDGHPDVMRLPVETHVVSWHAEPDPVTTLLQTTRFGALFAPGTEERTVLEAELRARLPGPADVRTALLALLEACALARPHGPAQLWLEKTPKHVRSLPVLLAAFGPATRAVILLRDPRATFASHKARWGRAGARSARRFAHRWAEVDALARRLTAERADVLVLRYEDLVADTEASMRTLAAHVGIAFESALLQPTRRGQKWAGNSSYAESRQGVSGASLERWRQSLTPEEIATLEQALGPRLAERGYAPSPAARAAPLRRWVDEAVVAARLWRLRNRWRREARRLHGVA